MHEHHLCTVYFSNIFVWKMPKNILNDNKVSITAPLYPFALLSINLVNWRCELQWQFYVTNDSGFFTHKIFSSHELLSCVTITFELTMAAPWRKFIKDIRYSEVQQGFCYAAYNSPKFNGFINFTFWSIIVVITLGKCAHRTPSGLRRSGASFKVRKMFLKNV
jgi:hypothetical protein